jgi:hypothetical protein
LRRTSSAGLALRRAVVALARDDGAAVFFGAALFFGVAAFRCCAVLRAVVARFLVDALDPDLRAPVERLREDCLFGCGISSPLLVATGARLSQLARTASFV